MIIPPQFVRFFLTLLFFCKRFSILEGEYRLVEHNKHANQLLLNETKQNHYYFLHFLNRNNPLNGCVARKSWSFVQVPTIVICITRG